MLCFLRGTQNRVLTKTDPNEKPRIRTLLFNSGICKGSERLFTRRISILRESQLREKKFDEAAKIGLHIYNTYMAKDEGGSEDFSQVDEYFSDHIQYPCPDIITPGFEYYRDLYLVVIILFVVSFAVLLIECILFCFVIGNRNLSFLRRHGTSRF